VESGMTTTVKVSTGGTMILPEALWSSVLADYGQQLV
jgi:hypothetical protein